MGISNRALIYMTGLVLLGMAVLFLLNLKTIVTGQEGLQTYIKYNDVRGIAVKYNKLLYTLNFQQQNDTVRFLNQSVPKTNTDNSNREIPDIQQIIIYQFEGKPDILITPIAYSNDMLVYACPQWNAKSLLIEMSQGRLRELLSQTYDK